MQEFYHFIMQLFGFEDTLISGTTCYLPAVGDLPTTLCYYKGAGFFALAVLLLGCFTMLVVSIHFYREITKY